MTVSACVEHRRDAHTDGNARALETKRVRACNGNLEFRCPSGIMVLELEDVNEMG